MEQINRIVGQDAREQVSAGQAVKAMVLNRLGFVTAPLDLFERYFEGKATEHLIGAGVLAKHLNDDRLRRVLDQLYVARLSQVFLTVAMRAAEKFGVKRERAQSDSTSFHVHGEYQPASGLPAVVQTQLADGTEVEGSKAPQPIELTYGYSRDHRPDLKQFVMNLICLGDGDVPAFIELADGNQTDKTRFAQLLQEFRQQWTFEGLHVADSALYSKDNLQALEGLQWLTRVPLTLSEATELVSQLPSEQFSQSDLEGYRLAEVCSTYGGVAQRWIVVESQERQQADWRKLTTQLDKATRHWQSQLAQLCRQQFSCEPDALAAMTRFERQLKTHKLENVQVTARTHYQRGGRPAKDATPTHHTYHLQATLVLQQAAVAEQQRRAGRFILATNVLASQPQQTEAGIADVSPPLALTASQALRHYKAQQGSERCFRFLKDPLFFASSVFLKKPARVAALGLVMSLCLLVYNLGQRA